MVFPHALHDVNSGENAIWAFCVFLNVFITKFDIDEGDGVDSPSLAVDRLFVDPENGDFRLRPNSPARKMGFVPFDLSKVGLRSGKK